MVGLVGKVMVLVMVMVSLVGRLCGKGYGLAS